MFVVVVEGLLKLGLLLILSFVWWPIILLILIMCMVILDLQLDDALIDRGCPLVLPFDIDDLMLTGAFVCCGGCGLGYLWWQLPAWLRLAPSYGVSIFIFFRIFAEDTLVQDLLDIFKQSFCLQLLINGTALLTLPVLVILLSISLDLLLVLSHAI